MLIFGIDRSAFIAIHTFISLVAILTGFVVLFGLLNRRLKRYWNAIFLITTVLTSASGLLFPAIRVTPGIVLGVLSLLLLSIACIALYGFHLQGRWCTSYIVGSMIPFYLNLVILLAIGFARVPALAHLASATNGTAFKVAQVLLLVIAASVIGIAVKRFRLKFSSDRWRTAEVKAMPRSTGVS